MAAPKPKPLPLGSYVDYDSRSSSKRLVGCFSEMTDQDAEDDTKTVVPAKLRRMPGIRQPGGFNDNSGNAVRGMWEMAGIEYVVIGSTLYQAFPDAANPVHVNLTQVGTGIPGGGFVRMTDNGACLVILVPNSSVCYTYAPNGGGFQQLTASFFTTLGAIDCWFIDTFIVFLAENGTTFFNDDGRATSGNNQITFTTAASFTRAFGTDPFVGGTVDHREILLLGARTSEGYVNAGLAVGSPFASAPDSYIELGAQPGTAYAVAKQDQSVIWIANDRTVRRRNGQTPQRISNSGIENLLQQNPDGTQVDLTGCYALTPTCYGHPLWILTMPRAISPEGFVGRTVVYDCLTQKWFELESQGLGYWRPLCYHNGMGQQLLGDSQSSSVGLLDETTYTEYGSILQTFFTTQADYFQHTRMQHRRLEFITTMGGVPTATAAAPIVDLFVSDDGGKTFVSVGDPQDLGVQGDYTQRAQWWNLGQARDRVYKIRVTDFSSLFTVDLEHTSEVGLP